MNKILPICFFISIMLACSIQSATAKSSYSVGISGFHENYREPDSRVDVSETANYGSIDLGYTYTKNNSFLEVDVRASEGENNYSSPSGTYSGAKQYEGDIRFLGGFIAPARGGNILQPFTGLGTRIFEDKSKGVVTNLGFYGYDRRIIQIYLPIGASYQMNFGQYTFTPKAEYDEILFGRVNSRLGDPNVVNNQRPFSGYGLRGEMMLGKSIGKYTWQAGPFIRYWNLKDSKVSKTYYNPDGTPIGAFIEPQNTRLQSGLELKVKF